MIGLEVSARVAPSLKVMSSRISTFVVVTTFRSDLEVLGALWVLTGSGLLSGVELAGCPPQERSSPAARSSLVVVTLRLEQERGVSASWRYPAGRGRAGREGRMGPEASTWLRQNRWEARILSGACNRERLCVHWLNYETPSMHPGAIGFTACAFLSFFVHGGPRRESSTSQSRPLSKRYWLL